MKAIAAFSVLAFVALSVVGMKLRADAAPPLLRMGRQLHELERALPSREGRVLELNGAALRVRSGVSPTSAAALLDAFERECKQLHSSFFDPTLRAGDARQGFVACMQPEKNQLGRLRYLFAARERDGSSYLELWSPDGIDPEKMFPAEGDAPGHDLAGIPRPPGSRRLLSAGELAQPYGVALYSTAQSPVDVVRFYRDALARDDWQLAPAHDCTDPCRVLARKDGKLTIVLAQKHDGRTETTVLASDERTAR